MMAEPGTTSTGVSHHRSAPEGGDDSRLDSNKVPSNQLPSNDTHTASTPFRTSCATATHQTGCQMDMSKIPSAISSDTQPTIPQWTSPANDALHIETHVDDHDQTREGATRQQHEAPDLCVTPTSIGPTLLSPVFPKQGFPARSSSLRSVLSNTSIASSASFASTLPSPFLSGMTDLTPLPSPMAGGEFPGSWPGLYATRSRTDSSEHAPHDGSPKARPEPLQLAPVSPSRKKKGYGSLLHDAVAANAAAHEENKHGHGRHRSISDFKPEQLHNIRSRHVTMRPESSFGANDSEYHMKREAYLAEQRGLTGAAPARRKTQLPSPPPSSSSAAEIDDVDDEPGTEFLEIHCGLQKKRRRFRQLRQLGTGTFSTVVLATRERIPAHPPPEIERDLDAHQLVAIKIVQHGPAGGADGERIETGLKREIEMLKTVSHPSIIHLKACEYQSSRTLLVLKYCPGGDLFEFASSKRELVTPRLVQRMFAELVSAVTYLHTNWIVHRDIKLENVLVNVSSDAIQTLADPRTHPAPLVTLTDLGLSRRIPDPPLPPLLETRCGSEDYAAPEILLGQPYDGRQTDAWALGVLLYALMEGRLPFDPPPGQPERSRNTHRIARCDWIWCHFGDTDGDWDAQRLGAEDFAGAQPCVEGLLKKVRMGRKSLDDITALPWVQEGIQVPGGLRLNDIDDDDTLL